MNKPLVLALAGIAVFAGVVYFARQPVTESAAKAEPVKRDVSATGPGQPAVLPPPAARMADAKRPVAADPRLAMLMVSPDDGLIDFLADADGRVIKEVDNDPQSAGYRKPLREYTYAGGRVIRLVRYQYSAGGTQIVTADVTYKPDGSVDQVRESTAYQYPEKPAG